MSLDFAAWFIAVSCGLAVGQLSQLCWSLGIPQISFGPTSSTAHSSRSRHTRPPARHQTQGTSPSPPREIRPLPSRCPSPPQTPQYTPGLSSRPRTVPSPSDATESSQSHKRKTPPPASSLASRHAEPESSHKRVKADEAEGFLPSRTSTLEPDPHPETRPAPDLVPAGVRYAAPNPGARPTYFDTVLNPAPQSPSSSRASSAESSHKRKHEDDEPAERNQRVRRSESPVPGSSSQQPSPAASTPRRSPTPSRSPTPTRSRGHIRLRGPLSPPRELAPIATPPWLNTDAVTLPGFRELFSEPPLMAPQTIVEQQEDDIEPAVTLMAEQMPVLDEAVDEAAMDEPMFFAMLQDVADVDWDTDSDADGDLDILTL